MQHFVLEPAFVLHARPYRETSLLVEVLSAQHGRIGVLARGTQGPRKHLLRAALQPLQHIRLTAQQRGELAQLRSVEAIDAGPVLLGDAAMAGFYINELVLRLAPRQDPLPELYLAYARVRTRLALQEPLAWTLRRFERDLLDALGFGLFTAMDGHGEPLDPAARYRIDPEHGARRLRSERSQADRDVAPTGQALLALGEDRMPMVEDLPALRRALREVLAHHLGGRGLKSWELIGQLGRLTRAAE